MSGFLLSASFIFQDAKAWNNRIFPRSARHAFPEVIDMNEKAKGKSPRSGTRERPIPEEIYPVIDNDLARDNIENDLPAVDLNEL